MTATKLRYILIGMIILMIIAMGTGSWWLRHSLSSQVIQTDHAKIDAELSQLESEKLQKLQIFLVNQKDIVDRARQIAADGQQYSYQDQVVKDLTTYATRDGLSISSFDFGATNASGKTSQPSGGKTAFTVNLLAPIRYDQVLSFLHQIEQNSTKMQITSLTLAPDPRNPAQISNPTIGLEVFIKK
ncbi:MAG TPA: hypothetical protein VNX65_05225 [Patescibacteria group bacterium]|jgi:hypothetical protein|nr:hypothetical protein [Patescibacteria group bacterium]